MEKQQDLKAQIKTFCLDKGADLVGFTEIGRAHV